MTRELAATDFPVSNAPFLKDLHHKILKILCFVILIFVSLMEIDKYPAGKVTGKL
jgi:hypothetical protein